MEYYKDNHITIYNKDCRSMSELADGSVQMVCCSPPYWGLRKYSGEQELIWGENHCEHQWGEVLPEAHTSGLHIHKNSPQVVGADSLGRVQKAGANSGSFCSLCGAWKGAYGLEPTPEMYIEHTIEILREIRRVLRKDGVVLWNIGDSYASQAGGYSDNGSRGSTAKISTKTQAAVLSGKKRQPALGLKPKDLCLIPFRVALASQGFATVSAKEILQCADYLKEARLKGDWTLVEMVENLLRIWSQWAFLDGWWVRSVIVWSKNNPMPESVTDRPTESHEYILMLTKSGTTQYWTHRNHEGSRAQPKPDYRWVKRSRAKLDVSQFDENGRTRTTVGLDQPHDFTEILEERDTPPDGWTPKNKMGWDRVNLWQGHDYYWDADAVREPLAEGSWERSLRSELDAHSESRIRNKGTGIHGRADPAGRNIRTVWEFPTQPYPEAHFAVFPEKLPELCIKAATPEVGCCSKCGAPWERVTKPTEEYEKLLGTWTPDTDADPELRKQIGFAAHGKKVATTAQYETLGWQPTCKCNADKVPSVVLDPFAGAGTTLWVAKILNRRAVGYEISKEYCELALERNRQQTLNLI